MLGVRTNAFQRPEDVDAASRGAQSPENTDSTLESFERVS